jgi:hypothetical protein
MKSMPRRNVRCKPFAVGGNVTQAAGSPRACVMAAELPANALATLAPLAPAQRTRA